MPKTTKIIIAALLVSGVIAGACFVFGAGRGKGPEESPYEGAEVTELQQAADPAEDAEKLRISEVMIKNHCTMPDEDGDFSDWIEIENISAESVELKDWTLADSEDADGWHFPEKTLPAGERLLVWASGKDKTGKELHTDFSVSQDEVICLRNRHGYLCSKLICTGDVPDSSLCVNENGETVSTLYPTPGFDNSGTGYALWQESLSTAGPLVINEVAVANFTDYYTLGTSDSDWVEIKNISSEPVQMADYYLSDDNDDYRFWQFPEMKLAPGGKLAVLCDDIAHENTDVVVSAGVSLDSSSDELYLSDADGRLIDYAALRDIPYKCSYGRMDGENGWFYFTNPTPLSENANGCRRVSEMPETLTKDGIYDGVDSVTVELSAKGSIYYTTDGSLPTVKSDLYTEPITLDSTTVLRAVSVEEGAVPSRALSLSYIINENHSLPVLSLVSDDVGEFNLMYSNGNKSLELPGSLSFYEDGGSFTIGCGISMNGATSLHLPKKNLSVRFRGAYGQKTLDYDVFGGGITEFTNLTIRSGQDYYSAIIRDVLSENLCLEFSDCVITQRSRFCVLYVNGQYRGIYALKDKANEQLYASLAGVSKESVTMLKAPVYTNTSLYKDVFGFAFSNDMSDPENYSILCKSFDVDSFIDWIIMEGFSSNSDLWIGNVRYCMSTENDGRWRLVFHDLDCTFLSEGETFYNLLSSYSGEAKQVAGLACTLMRSEEFKDQFLKRAAEGLNTTLTNENVLREIDELAAQIESEVERDYACYGRTKEQWLNELGHLKSFVGEEDLRQRSIDIICELLRLDEQQREQYFG